MVICGGPRRGKGMAKLREVILLLVEGNPLPAHCKDHPLAGEWKRFHNCHIEPGRLLIYKIDGDGQQLVRIGTRADLF